MTLDTVHPAEAIEAVQAALANSIGPQFGVLFSEEEAEALLVALDRQGWTVEQPDYEQTLPDPLNSPQDPYEAPVTVHLHVSPSDTSYQIGKTMAAIRSATADHWA